MRVRIKEIWIWTSESLLYFEFLVRWITKKKLYTHRHEKQTRLLNPAHLCMQANITKAVTFSPFPFYLNDHTLFVACAAGLKAALVCQFSDNGSNNLPAEKQTYIYFVDFLDECESKFIHMCMSN